jgi:hypothetical protein
MDARIPKGTSMLGTGGRMQDLPVKAISAHVCVEQRLVNMSDTNEKQEASGPGDADRISY